MTTLRMEKTAEGLLVWDDRDPDSPVYLHRGAKIDPAMVDRVIADRARARAEAAADARWDVYGDQARAEIEAIKAALGPARLIMTDQEIRQHLLGNRQTIFQPEPQTRNPEPRIRSPQPPVPSP